MIELKEQDNKKISDILNKYLIDNEIDDDGDIVVDSESIIYIKVDNGNELIRMFSFLHLSDLANVQDSDFDSYIDFINSMNYFSKFSKLRPKEKKTPLLCESCLVLFGCIDETFLIKTIKRVEKEISNAKKATVNFKLILDDVIGHDQEPA